MFHYIYCIENLINGKVYVGKHSTEDIDDGYMGSGKLLNLAIKKHGIESFRKHILLICDSEQEALCIERQIVNEEFVLDENTYNLTLGGKGSWFAANQDESEHERRKQLGRLQMKKFWNDSEYRKRHRERMFIQNKRLFAEKVCNPPDWTGRHHRQETKEKMSKTHQERGNAKGEKNSQFGTMWIYHPELKKSQKIKKDELESLLEQGWIRGRKIKS